MPISFLRAYKPVKEKKSAEPFIEEIRNLRWKIYLLPGIPGMFLRTMVFTSWKPKIGRVVLHGNTKKSEDWPFFCASAKKVKVVEKSRNIAKLIVKNKNDKK